MEKASERVDRLIGEIAKALASYDFEQLPDKENYQTRISAASFMSARYRDYYDAIKSYLHTLI